MELLQKRLFFTLFFRQYSIGKCLYDILKRKHTFLGYKGRKFKNSKKGHFLDFFNVFFYSLERCFFVLEYRKRHFPGLYCLKKKLEKWPFLDQSFVLTLLEKKSIFRLFELHVLWPRKAFFRSTIS